MREFLVYFFGKSETEEFTNFGLAHFAPIIIMAAAITILYFIAYLPWLIKDIRKKRSPEPEKETVSA